MTNPVRVPSCLVSRVSFSLSQGLSCDEIINEFWSASEQWQCWEYMCQSFLVQDIISDPDNQSVKSYKALYDDDSRRSFRMWPYRIKSVNPG
jgi:hypothetical protein